MQSQKDSEKIISVIIIIIVSFFFYKNYREKSEKNKKAKIAAENSAIKAQEEEKSLNVKITEAQFDFTSSSFLAKNIGGSGFPFTMNQPLSAGISKSALIIIKRDSSAERIEIPFKEINELEISGPGTVTTNAGASGGGFGLEGFIKGAVAAAIINAATTTKSTNTFMRVLSTTGEIYLHTSAIEPAALKMKLSPVFVHLANRSKQQAVTHTKPSVSEEIRELKKLLEDGVLSQEEFDTAKKKVIS